MDSERKKHCSVNPLLTLPWLATFTLNSGK